MAFSNDSCWDEIVTLSSECPQVPPTSCHFNIILNDKSNFVSKRSLEIGL